MPEQITNCGVQSLSQRQAMQAGAVLSARHGEVQNAAPHATVAPVQATQSSDSVLPVISSIVPFVQASTHVASASMVSWGQLGKHAMTAGSSAPQPAIGGSGDDHGGRPLWDPERYEGR